MTRVLAVCSMVLVVVVSGLVAQAPNFSGKWTIDKDKTATIQPPSNQYVGGTNLEVTMDTHTMTVVSTGGRAGTVKNVYKLDGTENQNFTAVNALGGGASANAVMSTAKWDGVALVIAIKLYNATATLKYSIDAGDLRMDFVNPQSGSRTPKTAFYKRAS